jgi:diguanylate cyclase
MERPETGELAQRHAATAFEALERHEIPPTPQNFAVWYAYAAERMPELNQSLDILVGNRQVSDDCLNQEIYEQFFGEEDEGDRFLNAGARLDAMMVQLLEALGVTGEKVSDYNESLGGFASHLDGKAPEGISHLIHELLHETRKIQARNEKLEASLESSSSEIKDLRRNLASVRKEALTDPLTAIGNRKYFDLSLAEWLRHAGRNGEPLCLLMLDIDHFKNFNDKFGHPLGDQVLRLVAATIGECVKGRDVVARYGGEEFSVILPKTGLNSACTVGDQIRQAVANKEVTKKSTAEKLGQITPSVGVAQFRSEETGAELIVRADEALYAAKQRGRNCVVADSELYAINASTGAD